jgi:hypothetical protein
MMRRKERKMQLWEAIDGYKTYIIVAVFLALVALEKIGGFDIPGFEVGEDWIGVVLGAFGVGALRSGVKKAE